MKFYYDGKLVRTSKTHEYHYGIYNKRFERMRSCHSTKELAEKELNTYINQPLNWNENTKEAIKAFQSGKKGYWSKEGHRSFFIPFEKGLTVEALERSLKENQERHELRKNTFCVVELEVRN